MRFSAFMSKLLDRWPVKIICLALAIVLYIFFRFNTLTERQIVVPLKVNTSEGFIVSSDFPARVNVTLRGEDEDIKEILPDDIEAFADLTGFNAPGEYKVPVQFHKKGSALQIEALEIRSRPKEIILSQERRLVRSLSISPELTGFPALGYELTQYFVSPSSVTVIGPESQLKNLKELRTELIDLSGRRSDFTVTTRIVRPSPQIQIPGGLIVEFRGIVEEAVIMRTIADRDIVIFDLPEGLKITGELPKVTLTVQGSQISVEGAKPQEMTFFLDCSGIKSPGKYTLPLKMDIPSGLAILQLIPREVEITVEKAEPENNKIEKEKQVKTEPDTEESRVSENPLTIFNGDGG